MRVRENTFIMNVHASLKSFISVHALPIELLDHIHYRCSPGRIRTFNLGIWSPKVCTLYTSGRRRYSASLLFNTTTIDLRKFRRQRYTTLRDTNYTTGQYIHYGVQPERIRTFITVPLRMYASFARAQIHPSMFPLPDEEETFLIWN